MKLLIVVLASFAALIAPWLVGIASNEAGDETHSVAPTRSGVDRAADPRDATESPASDSLSALTRLANSSTLVAKTHWARGEVRFAGQWATPEAVAEAAINDSDRAAYCTLRGNAPDTSGSHLRLAQWCHAHELADEHRAHLLVAAQLDPSDQRPYRALGLIEHGGVWVTEAEAVQARDREAMTRRAFHEWKTRLQSLRQELGSANPATRTNAEAQVAAIGDPLAIPALEEMLSRENESWGLLVVDAVGRMLHKAATRSLIRHATWHDAAAVREAAIKQLRHRDAEHYVGDLIHLMRPAGTQMVWTTTSSGQAASVTIMQDFDRNYVTIAVVDPNKRYGPLAHKAAERPENRRFPIQAQLDALDAKSRFRIKNAHAALTRTTSEDFGIDQPAWVSWWHDVRYVNPAEYAKPYRTTVVRYESIGVFDPATASCFVAGTPVWTRRGMVPIDHVQLGDLVLSKNVETGELGYQPVIDRTIRRPRATLRLEFDDETIGVTGGHPIWSPARGWLRAREFKTSDAIGTSSDATTLIATSEGPSDFVYNLVVAGSSTYFVGRNKILVHDITSVADLPIETSPDNAATE